MRRQIAFENRGEQIFGVFHYPEGAKNLPTVLLCHGFTGHKAEGHRIFVKMAQELEKKGIAALRIDFRGSGDSEGDFQEMTFEGEVEDAKLALDFLEQLPEVNPQRLGALGLSMGGAVAATIAGRDSRIQACGLWSAVADFSQTFFSEAAEEVLAKGAETMAYGANVVSREFLLGVKDAKPHLELAKRQLPVLVVHGTQDETVPFAQAALYKEACVATGSSVTYHPVEGADHTYHSPAWEGEVIAETATWFEQNL